MPSDLVRACQAAHDSGADFPTIWQTILKPHPLVSGKPVQSLKDGRPHLEIPLSTGHWVVLDTTCSRYGLWPEIRTPSRDG